MIKKLLKDTAIYGGSDVILKFIAFATFPIYTHMFSVSDFGIMELLSTLAGLVSMFMNPGLNNAVQRFYWDPQTKESDHPVLVSSGLWTLLLSSIIVTIIVVGLGYPFRNIIYAKNHLPWLLVVLVLITNIPSQLLQYNLDTIRLHFAPWKFTILSVLKNLAGILLGLYLIIIVKQGIAGFFWGNLIVLTLSVPFGLLLTKKDIRFEFDFNVARRLVLYGYPFIFVGLAYWIFGSLDRWMLGFMTDNTQVGYFSISFKLGVILIFINSAFGQAWSPYSVKIYAEHSNYRQIFSQILSYWFFGLTIVGAVLTLFAQEILMLLTPLAYWQAKSVMGYIAMGLVFYGTTQLTAFGISIEKRTQLFSVAAWTTACINLVLNLILIPLLKANGAALASMISYMSLTGMYLFWTQKLHPLPLEKSKLLLSLFIVILAILIIQFFYLFNWSWLIVCVKTVLLSLFIFTGYQFKLIPMQSILAVVKKPK